MRNLVAAAALSLAIVPTTAAASSTPDPDTLRKMLVNAPDSSWVEASVGETNTLEGPFDSQSFVQLAFGDAQTQLDAKSRLEEDGFVAGYGRSYYKSSNKGQLEEDLIAFDSKAGASSYWGWVKSWLNDGVGSTGAIDTSSIPNSFGGNYIISGFHGSELLFVKGANVYDIVAGSDAAYLQSDALAFSRAAYEFAPSGDTPVQSLTTPSLVPSPAPAGNDSLVVAIVSAGFLVLGACLIGGLIAAIFLVRRRSAPPNRTVLSPDGNYWWDGSSWQPVPRA